MLFILSKRMVKKYKRPNSGSVLTENLRCSNCPSIIIIIIIIIIIYFLLTHFTDNDIYKYVHGFTLVAVPPILYVIVLLLKEG